MRFWIRELMGTLLVLLGLYIFFIIISVLASRTDKLLESIPWTVIGVVVFRGGIHLLKVAVAARVAMRVQDEVKSAKGQKPRPKRQLEW